MKSVVRPVTVANVLAGGNDYFDVVREAGSTACLVVFDTAALTAAALLSATWIAC
ncbi:hypothetical protein GNZ13_20105 [Paraburkholderia sp. 5N]|uniref:Uncharacterized protein n=1 Tax=Paraburkholderia elongata TaxID=2675747 RepID=A0A972NPV1_9BURK|nr:hypothetical protein [Paraburkholderia elongata]